MIYRWNVTKKYDFIFWQMSCVEHLCDTLCYQLDLSSFVACVNSGRSWNRKCSLTLSGKEQIALRDEDAHFDPFVENFVLERLSVQSPLRVMLPCHMYHTVICKLGFQYYLNLEGCNCS